jgi:tetratricopeptide (TPR) repeat protein
MRASQLLNEAVELQRKGELAGAESLYLRLLEAYPDHLDALQMLGLLRYQQGRFDDALASMGTAPRASPNSPSALLNYAVVLDALSGGQLLALAQRGADPRDLMRPYPAEPMRIRRNCFCAEAGRRREHAVNSQTTKQTTR